MEHIRIFQLQARILHLDFHNHRNERILPYCYCFQFHIHFRSKIRKIRNYSNLYNLRNIDDLCYQSSYHDKHHTEYDLRNLLFRNKTRLYKIFHLHQPILCRCKKKNMDWCHVVASETYNRHNGYFQYSTKKELCYQLRNYRFC